MEQKKPTNAQLLKRIKTAVLHIDKTKDTNSLFFSDTGLRITVNEEYAVIATGFHRHVYDAFTAAGVSRPYLYSKRLIKIADENDCVVEGSYSFSKLLDTLKAKEDQTEYNLVTFIGWWLRNIFAPLYSIGESEAESFLVYLDYIYNLAKNTILLSEHTEDLTNKGIINELVKNIKELTDGIDERVIFPKKTDEEVMRENIEAVQQEESEQILNGNGTE